jgi:effector-binding domain-containing protein
MSTPHIGVRPLPPLRLAELTTDVEAMEQGLIGPAIGPLFGRLIGALGAAGLAPIGPSVAYYETLAASGAAVGGAVPGGNRVRVHAGFPVPATVGVNDGWAIAELGAVDAAATLIHHGSMEAIGAAWAALADFIAGDPELSPAGTPREVYLNAMPMDDQSMWVTELQWPVVQG